MINLIGFANSNLMSFRRFNPLIMLIRHDQSSVWNYLNYLFLGCFIQFERDWLMLAK